MFVFEGKRFQEGAQSKSLFVLILCLISTALSGCNNKLNQANTSSSTTAESQIVDVPYQHPATSKILGKWVVIGDTSGQGHTGSLDLKPDLTFMSIYITKSSKDTMSGTFTVSDEKVAGENLIGVELTILKYNNKPAPSPGPLRLYYDPESKILHDFLSVAYSRPGEIVKGKKYFERK